MRLAPIFILAFVLSCSQMKEAWEALPDFTIKQGDEIIVDKDCETKDGKEKCVVRLPEKK